MSHFEPTTHLHRTDTAPGDERLDSSEISAGIKSYLIGLGLAIFLTIVSFFISGTTLVWGPSIPVALIVLAIAQMGVHLVFFLHVTTGPDNVNNVMALAFGVLIVLLLLTGSLWIMSHLNHNMAFMDEAMQMQPGGGSEVRVVTANGIVGPAATTPVSARVPGVIQTLRCKAKMQVKAGELCAKIDPRPYQITVEQSRAGLQAAEARLEKDKADLAEAKAAFERQPSSQKTGKKPRRALERAQSQINRGEARITKLQAALHAAEASLGYTDIVSPIDGTVVSRNAELGETIAAGSATPPLFVIAADPALAHINATISAKDSGEIRPGDKATFTIEAFPDRPFSGTVTQFWPSPQIDEHAAATRVVISAPNPELLLKPGMAATIRIVIERPEGTPHN